MPYLEFYVILVFLKKRAKVFVEKLFFGFCFNIFVIQFNKKNDLYILLPLSPIQEKQVKINTAFCIY